MTLCVCVFDVRENKGVRGRGGERGSNHVISRLWLRLLEKAHVTLCWRERAREGNEDTECFVGNTCRHSHTCTHTRNGTDVTSGKVSRSGLLMPLLNKKQTKENHAKTEQSKQQNRGNIHNTLHTTVGSLLYACVCVSTIVSCCLSICIFAWQFSCDVP